MRSEHYEIWIVKGDKERSTGRDFNTPAGALRYVETAFQEPYPGKVEVRKIITITNIERTVIWDSEVGER